jgi:hypothetical protein
VLTPTSAAIAGLLLTARPVVVAPAALLAAVATARLARRLRVRRPTVTAARLVALGALGAAGQAADAVNRHYWPVTVLVALLSRRARHRVLAVALAEGVLDWWRHRDRDDRVRPGLLGHLVAHRLDDLAYGAGLWWGAWRERTAEPLRPVGPSNRTSPIG